MVLYPNKLPESERVCSGICNYAIQCYPAEKLIELNRQGKLKGELKEIASKLNDEDNPVLLIAKFKE